jgi:hypothetical protein
MRLITPDEALTAAKEQMLGGREPETHEDWVLVMNFLAANVHHDVAESACRLLRSLYKMPLTDDEVHQICRFHAAVTN